MKSVLIAFCLFAISATAFAEPDYRAFHSQNVQGDTDATEGRRIQAPKKARHTDYLEGPFAANEIIRELKSRKQIRYLSTYMATGYTTRPLAGGEFGYFIKWSVSARRGRTGLKRFTPYESDRYYLEGPFRNRQDVQQQLTVRRDRGNLYQGKYFPQTFIRENHRYYILWSNW